MFALSRNLTIDNVSRQRYGDVGVCKSPYLVKRSVCDIQNKVLSGLCSRYINNNTRYKNSNKKARVLVDIQEQDILWLKGIVIIEEDKVNGRAYKYTITLSNSLMYETLLNWLKSGVSTIDYAFLELYRTMWFRYYSVKKDEITKWGV